MRERDDTMQPNFSLARPSLDRPLRVLHVSHSDLDGGAAIAANRLHRALRLQGVDSKILVWNKKSQDRSILPYRPRAGLVAGTFRWLRRQRIKRQRAKIPATDGGLFTLQNSECGTEMLRNFLGYDIINFHWISEFIDLGRFLPPIVAHTPVVWTIHDMNPFTGGCHYTSGCTHFQTYCRKCPQLRSGRDPDLSTTNWYGKVRAFGNLLSGAFHVVSCSDWIGRECRSSSLMGKFPCSTIHGGVDMNVFKPIPKAASRAVLGLPPDARIVLFVAQSVKDPRKGFRFLIEALANIAHLPGLHLVTLGNAEAIPTLSLPMTHLGTISDERMLAAVYSAADVFAISSLEDNLPNTVVEAIACGTPVAGFAVGGIPEIVRTGFNGILVEQGEVAALSRALEEILVGPGESSYFAKNARTHAVENFNISTQAQKYAALYGDMAVKRFRVSSAAAHTST